MVVLANIGLSDKRNTIGIGVLIADSINIPYIICDESPENLVTRHIRFFTSFSIEVPSYVSLNNSRNPDKHCFFSLEVSPLVFLGTPYVPWRPLFCGAP